MGRNGEKDGLDWVMELVGDQPHEMFELVYVQPYEEDDDPNDDEYEMDCVTVSKWSNGMYRLHFYRHADKLDKYTDYDVVVLPNGNIKGFGAVKQKRRILKALKKFKQLYEC